MTHQIRDFTQGNDPRRSWFTYDVYTGALTHAGCP